MTSAVTALWGHPIKSHGRERLNKVSLIAGKTMPGDRVWAVRHDSSGYDGTGWAPCQNFMIGSRAPLLAGLWAQYDNVDQKVALRHSLLGDFEFHPDDPDEAQRFIEWIRPLAPENRAKPQTVVKALDRGMTDTDFPSVSIINQSSHRAVAQKLGFSLEPERWRGNIWLEGLAPWEEFDWVGKSLQIGNVKFLIRERIVRCQHTAANPNTGQRDADTLGALQDGWDHQDFGVYAEVLSGGELCVGDTVRVL